MIALMRLVNQRPVEKPGGKSATQGGARVHDPWNISRALKPPELPGRFCPNYHP